MAAGVYSHRFFVTMGANVVTTYVPPLGTRAVIRSVTATSFATGGGSARVLIAGTSVWQASFTGPGTSANADMRHVVYGGELMQGYTAVADVVLVVSGYLFTDSTRAAGAPGHLGERELGELGELPIELPA